MEMNRREEAPALTEIIIFQQGRLEINKETHKKKNNFDSAKCYQKNQNKILWRIRKALVGARWEILDEKIIALFLLVWEDLLQKI